MPNQVGLQTAVDNSIVNPRAGKSAEAIVGPAHGFYHEPVSRGVVFSGSVVGQVTTVGLATTYTGLCLSNPITSSVHLSLISAGYAFLVAPVAAMAVGLMTGYNAATNVTHTTAVTSRSQKFVDTGVGTGLLDSAATLPTAPTLNLVFGSGLTGAITTTPMGAGAYVTVDGLILLPPGAYVAFYTSTASGAASGAFSLTWEEIPVANI